MINNKLQEILDKQTDSRGIKVSMVERKQVNIPTEMQRAIARQAEAERKGWAATIHLRFLQTLTKVSSEKNSTMIIPLSIDLFTASLQKKGE